MPATAEKTELVITRVFDAPRELVWQVWTEPQHVAQWYGPKGFATRVNELDLRPGGHWRYVMVSPDGSEYPIKGEFREVVLFERIASFDEPDDGLELEDGADHPMGNLVTCVFDDLGDQTQLTMRITHGSVEDSQKYEEMGAVAGWNASFDRLAEHLVTLAD